MHFARTLTVCGLLIAGPACASAVEPNPPAAPGTRPPQVPVRAAPAGVQEDADSVELPDLRALAASGMRDVIGRWRADRETLERFFDLEASPTRRARLSGLHATWLEGLESIDFASLPRAQQVDYLLLASELRHSVRELELEGARQAEVADLLGFAGELIELHEARRRLEPVDARSAADALTRVTTEVKALRERVRPERETAKDDDARKALDPVRARRAADLVEALRDSLGEWYGFHGGYDPLFTWWVAQPFETLDEELESCATWLRKDVAGVAPDDKETIVGEPVGREALLADLQHEWIPYTPEELIEIADREMAWCRERMLEASNELGFGDDWRAALEHVKGLHVGPGEQTGLVIELAREIEAYLDQHQLVTVPKLARQTWHMEMMSPERQKVNPFFLGGETVIVAFPTDAMSHEDKLMSLRANNVHFSRAVVHHELIPGHRLQHFMQQRFATHRRSFGTPFWGEGWALYWELLLWDRGFARGPEDRIGMLFWRMHRCARIRFSLSFHLGTMTPQECVDLLVDEVGHERASAEGEVRRSFQGGYSPLYQCAYMLGGLQLRALHAELVGSGRMGEREFHDAVLQQNSIPIELVRAALGDEPLTRDQRTTWRF